MASFHPLTRVDFHAVSDTHIRETNLRICQDDFRPQSTARHQPNPTHPHKQFDMAARPLQGLQLRRLTKPNPTMPRLLECVARGGGWGRYMGGVGGRGGGGRAPCVPIRSVCAEVPTYSLRSSRSSPSMPSKMRTEGVCEWSKRGFLKWTAQLSSQLVWQLQKGISPHDGRNMHTPRPRQSAPRGQGAPVRPRR